MESTGDIIFYGKEKKNDPSALQIYKYKNGWENIGTKPFPSSHDDLFILPVMIDNSECLLVSCWQCKTVWFCDIDSGKFSEALKGDWFFPGLMQKGEGDYILIVSSQVGPIPILKVKCTPTELITDKTEAFYSRMEMINFMCYLPNVKSVALSHWQDHVVKAIHYETGQMVWQVMG